MHLIYAASKGEWSAIPRAAARAFEQLEAAIPPRRRKIVGYWHPPLLEYRACYVREPVDRPDEVHLFDVVIPGGHYRRARVEGNDASAQIPLAFEALERLGSLAEDGRPWLEIYRRRDQVDVLVPIVSNSASGPSSKTSSGQR
jgi:hypothetical protein